MELTIEEALQQGISAHKAGKLEEAERLYRAIIGSVPTHSDANHNLGVLAVGVGKVDTALPYFKTALEASPNHGQYWISYIDALIKLGRIDDASKVLEQGKAAGLSGDAVTELESRLSGSVKVEQSEIDNLVNLYSAGKLSEALSMGTALINRQPDNYIVHNILGATFLLLGLYERSLIAYKKSLVLNSTSIAHNDMGVALSNLKKGCLAIKQYRYAIYLDPDNYSAHNNLGSEYDKSNNYCMARGYLENAFKIKSDYAEAYCNYAALLCNLGEIVEANYYCKLAAILKPSLSDTYNNYGLVLFKQGDIECAAMQYGRSLKINAMSPVFYANLGVALKEQQLFKGARQNYFKSVILDPQNHETFNNLGILYNLLNHKKRTRVLCPIDYFKMRLSSAILKLWQSTF